MPLPDQAEKLMDLCLLIRLVSYLLIHSAEKLSWADMLY